MQGYTEQAVMLMRGSKGAHARAPFKFPKGTFTLVTDAPELRFHNGVTPGGIAIPLNEDLHQDMLDIYEYRQN
jgi:hypothetical protein